MRQRLVAQCRRIPCNAGKIGAAGIIPRIDRIPGTRASRSCFDDKPRHNNWVANSRRITPSSAAVGCQRYGELGPVNRRERCVIQLVTAIDAIVVFIFRNRGRAEQCAAVKSAGSTFIGACDRAVIAECRSRRHCCKQRQHRCRCSNFQKFIFITHLKKRQAPSTHQIQPSRAKTA